MEGGGLLLNKDLLLDWLSVCFCKGEHAELILKNKVLLRFRMGNTDCYCGKPRSSIWPDLEDQGSLPRG